MNAEPKAGVNPGTKNPGTTAGTSTPSAATPGATSGGADQKPTDQKADADAQREAARRALADIFVNAVRATRTATAQALKPSSPLPYDLAGPMRAFSTLAMNMMAQPTALMEFQRKAWSEWADLWSASLKRQLGEEGKTIIETPRGDRRFMDPGWAEPFFDHLRQSYLLAAKHLSEAVAATDGLDDGTRREVDFFLKQYINAISPSNFPMTNPQVVRETLQSGGVNLLNGLANLLADVADGHGLIKRRATGDFELGVTIATTPGSIIYQNALMQLIQYTPSTESVHKRPLLYVPPLVNKYYMLDLQPKSSMLKWLVDQGHTVFTISWVNPGADLRQMGLADYIKLGPLAAMDAIKDATGETTVDLMGFCMGGALVAIAMAYLAKTKQAGRVGSGTVIGTLLDFRDLGEWSVFTTDGHASAFNSYLDSKGFVEAQDLERLFSIVRANDLVWSSVVNHYLLDKDIPPSDILWWFADGARIPEAFLKDYVGDIMRRNLLREPNGVTIDGAGIDFSKVKAPFAMVSLKDDHVSAWAATYSGSKLFGGPVKFLLGGSGHNAGVINPPAAGKHGYWSNKNHPDTAEEWLAGAEKKDGSWWPEWQQWLVAQSKGEKVPARKVGGGKLKPIEPAPGSYVRVRHQPGP